MDRLEKHRWKLHNKIQQHKGKFGKYMPLEEIQDHIDIIVGVAPPCTCKGWKEKGAFLWRCPICVLRPRLLVEHHNGRRKYWNGIAAARDVYCG